MKTFLLALAVLALPGGLQAARPVVIGTNGGGPLSRAANVGWARVSVYWSEVEPSPGEWDWGTADYIVDRARSNGQQVLYILSGAPAWACGGCTNGAARPADIELWKRFVAAVVAHMKGRVAAYEIWNEPDLSGNATYGVGWDADVDAYPRYVDYMVEASRIIRATDPAARVVGLSLSGGWNFRTLQILSQVESTEYPDGNASTFLDVVSVHANARDGTSAEAAYRLWLNKLYPLQTYNPRNAGKPIWVSEFGWDSDAIGEEAQRDRIREFLVAMTGADSRLAPFRITHAFIYALHIGCVNGGQGIYDCDVAPKAVVTDYLQTLEFPAVQPVGPPLAVEGTAFYTLTPCRLFDTRNAEGPYGGPALGPRTQREFPVALRCGLPATARAVAVNVTATAGADYGYLVVFPGNYAPLASTVNFRPGTTRANSTVIGLTPIGGVTVGAGQFSGPVHVIVDVSGYFE